MKIDNSLIEEIVQRILSVVSPDKIILFGSAAQGKMSHDSDIDLLIVEPEPGKQQEEYLRIRRSLRGINYPFDIILISTQWFEESKDIIGGIAYPANKYGQVIYETA